MRPQTASPSSPSQLRVLQVNSLFNAGGADNQTLELALGLKELGVESALAVAADCRWEQRARQLGLPVYTFAARSPLRWVMIWRLARLIRERRVQIVHAHQGRDYWPLICAVGLGRRRAHVFITRHLMTRPRLASRALLLRCAEVIAVSKAVEALLRRELRGPAGNIHQVFCGIDVYRFVPERSPEVWAWREQLGWKPEQVVFGVVGAYHRPRGKGQLEFLEAAAMLHRQFPNARFAIVGQGDLEDHLRQRREALCLADACALVPFTDDNAILMRGLDVLVHPAVGTDAFPLVVLEGMACGKPVIASKLDGIPEQFRHGEQGLLVPPRDPAALAEAMATLLREPDLASLFGRAGRARVEANFTRQHLARQVLELYRQVVASET